MHFIDFEVFKHDWLCVIQSSEVGETVIVNDEKALTNYYEAHKNELFIGYNIRGYDQFIFKAILAGFNPKDVNDFIIVQGQSGYRYSSLFNKIPLYFFDVKTQMVGLKTLEGFMGEDIRETTVPFNIDRKLTAGELDEVIFYCRHDVKETIKVFKKQSEEFTSQFELVKMFNFPITYMGKTKAQLSAAALGAERKNYNDEFDFVIPNNLKIKKYKFVVDWFGDRIGKKSDDFYKQSLNVDVAGVPHVFAWGGIHGAIPNYRGKGYFINVDVASYYPSMMIEYGYTSRSIKDGNKYKEIYQTRLAHKAKKDPRQKPLKIVLNSTYGAMKDKFNPLYDPLQANNVCVTGQLLLLDLLEHLEPYFDIIQSNTDGILVKLRANNDKEANEQYALLDDLCHEWEQRSKMNLEFDEFREVIQKDVNNYIIVAPDGGYKSKGAYVKKLNDLDYDLPIVNKATINYFVKNIPVEKTVNECTDLREFQKIVKVSYLYKYAMHNGKQLNEKTFRVFASTNPNDGTIYKVKDGRNPEKFANTPDNCFIDNSKVFEKSLPNYLNKQWYIELANKRLKDFIGE